MDLSCDTHEAHLVHLVLDFTVNWNPSEDSLRIPAQRLVSQCVLDRFCGENYITTDTDGDLLPQAFYDAAFVPDPSRTDILSQSIPGVVSRLYPFQRRAVQWLLQREGQAWQEDEESGRSGLQPHTTHATDLPLSFITSTDVEGNRYYVSSLYHVVCREIAPYQQRIASVRGGILAEEMGLGKTVETISLIALHTRTDMPNTFDDIYTGQVVEPTPATLIVTPTTLKRQWLSEFERHAPGLRVMTYEGMKKTKASEKDIIEQFKAHDVVIVTYNVLQAEIHFAEDPPDRAMRRERKYHRPKSPLVQLSWWRVCLDEAQQIESGVSAAAKVARLIPRVNAWGITGTPVKENIKDLWGLLLFLRYEPFASSSLIWDRLTSSRKDLFKPLFNSIALRHTKRAVRNELELPPQKRYVITMPFTAVEEQHYQSQFQSLARGFGLDEQGNPIEQDWDPEDPYVIDLMKRALAQLRQSVLHPEVGPGRLRTVGQRNKPLRTIEEVLDVMIDQAETTIKTEQRAYLASKLKRGQLLENSPRVKEALSIWQEVRQESETIVLECRRQLKEAKDAARKAGVDDGSSIGDSDSEDDIDEDEVTKAIRRRVGECRRKLRSALDIFHRAVFFIASAHFQIKTNEDMTQPESEEFKSLEELEIKGYEEAKDIRKEILHEAHAKATRLMRDIAEDAASQNFIEIPEFKASALQGIESRRTLSNLEQLGGALDEQANLVDEWRENVIQLLLRPLVDEEAEAEVTGEEYQDSTQIQDDLMAYTLVLRAAIADRQDALSGLQNDRVRYETQFAERQAKDGEGPAPERTLALLQQRNEIKPKPDEGSLRGVITDLRELATKLRHDAANGSTRARNELVIVQKQLHLTQEQINEQTKAATAMEKELDIFTAAMNARIEYYRQLQAVSDTVAPLEREENEDVDARLSGMIAAEASLQSNVSAAQSKHRYLMHLKDAGKDASESKFCVICQASFTLGVLTVCGHQFCKECMMLWFKAHHNCPVCKKHLTAAMLHDITFRKQELRLHKDQSHQLPNGQEQRSKSKRAGIYTSFNEEKLKRIMEVELNGPSFATKIDTLIRHLLWLREEDPGAKAIIFSQFKDFLDVLARAFERFRVGFTSFDKKDGITKFKEDPGIECFLMDARAHASGLNLVNASHVFLCEPLLNTALELQAIARVDRIGQEHETTVWLYLVEGTVEESIYNISVRRRMAHMGSNGTVAKSGDATPEVTDLTIEAANSLELQQAALTKLMSKDKQLGEVVEKDDIWECLFGHLSGKTSGNTNPGNDDRFSNPAVLSFLAAESAEARRLE
ncbi:SNF2 family N-terminal domain-containing protein [Microdochium trichocladiopsis]|uniref:SNF2 family N-terminal domain-containing protein n=1 Tax=Microdochium trichocladiopsis TaxID=1682393 RepID=A0A9P9BVF7_9PEZI|nr:SNF2 family N-terminal domain-containing protein [Microdochium trichocladiopsis]KAH7033297.1 SNF2 family N-terminal domain-containing protein [Microdochium trichocladiopsis]